MLFTNKWLFFVVVFTAPSMASAAWTLVYTNGQNKSAIYIDYATIRKEGSIRRVWELSEHPGAKSTEVRSLRTRTEYDCANERFRLISTSTHTGPLASGQTTFSYDDNTGPWHEIPPGSPVDAILKIVCSK